MQEKIIKSEETLDQNNYRAWYRCTNCGTAFQYDMHKGRPAANMRGRCPHCGAGSGDSGIGTFPIIKFNPELDENKRYYYK